MGRIFSIVAAIAASMILLASIGTYWFSSAGAKSAELAAVQSVANGLAGSIGMQIGSLQQSVDGVAQSPDVVAALRSGNAELIGATATKLQGVVPYSLRLRLLLPNIAEPDQSAMPHMGFGDLEMVRATLNSKPKPVIQGEGEHRHLAITSQVVSDQQVIGVVLASIKPDLPQKIIANTKFDDGLVELKQDQLTLASLGKSAAKDDDPENITVANSRWQINYWADVETTLTDISLLTAIILIPTLAACLSFFVGYRKFAEFLRQDSSSILKAAKDMMQGKSIGNYPMEIDELMPVIASLAQFKRVLEQEATAPVGGAESKEYDFFDESFDIDFLEDTPPPLPTAKDIASTSIPIHVSAPSIGQADEFVTPQKPAQETTSPETWDFDSQLKPTVAIPSNRANAPAANPEYTAGPASLAAASERTLPGIFRDYDIRGIAGKNLTEEVVSNIGRAFASEARELDIKTVVVARDGRLSSPSLSDALIKGIIATGCNVLDIGLVPTPVLYFVAHHTEGRTGIMVTGSHNPAECNGLKMVLNGETPSFEEIQTLKQRIDNGDYRSGETGTVEPNTLFSNEYIGIIAEDTHIVRPMTVVVDCSNGAAGKLAPTLLKTIGCDVIELNCEIDGRFPNHQPDPSKPEHLDALIKAVKLNNADIGIAFDGDGDRLGVVDSSGKIIWPDRQMMLFARDVLSAKTGAEIIFDVASSKHLPEQIAKRGGRALLSKSSYDEIRSLIKETGAALAGTMDGHIFFNDRWFGFDDGLYAAARLIEILSADMRSSSELFNDLPDSINTPELRIPLDEGEASRFIEQLLGQANFDGSIDNTDGIKVEFADGWGVVRASTTEPALTMRFEADTREALSRIQAQFKFLMLQIKPDISLPF